MPNPLIDYLRTSKEELEKVSWPSKEDTFRYTTLIVVGSVLAAVFFGALDFGLSNLVQTIIKARTPQTAPTQETVPINPTDIQAVDQNGNPVNLNVQPIPIDAPTPAPSTNTP